MKNQKQLKKLISRLVKETVVSKLKEDVMNVTQDKDLKRGLESPMGFVNIGENANEAFRFIFYGANSGNVYGVSNADTIQKAWDEFKKTTVRTTAGDASDAEYDKAKIEFLNGYAVVEHPQSDEGTFGIIDINSPNPSVQHEIKALGLMKYAQEYLRDRHNESIAPDGRYVDDMESGMAVKKMHNLNEGQKYDQAATAMLEDFTARFLLGVKQAGAVDRPTLERVKRETVTQFVRDTFYEYFPSLLGVKIGEQSASGAAGGFATPFAFKKKEEEVNEMTATGAVAGYQTPYAFSKKKSGSQRALDVTTKMGYKKVKDIDEVTRLDENLTTFANEKVCLTDAGGTLVEVDDVRPGRNGKRMYVAVTKDGFNTDYPILHGQRVFWDNPEYFPESFKTKVRDYMIQHGSQKV